MAERERDARRRQRQTEKDPDARHKDRQRQRQRPRRRHEHSHTREHKPPSRPSPDRHLMSYCQPCTAVIPFFLAHPMHAGLVCPHILLFSCPPLLFFSCPPHLRHEVHALTSSQHRETSPWSGRAPRCHKRSPHSTGPRSRLPIAIAKDKIPEFLAPDGRGSRATHTLAVPGRMEAIWVQASNQLHFDRISSSRGVTACAEISMILPYSFACY